MMKNNLPTQEDIDLDPFTLVKEQNPDCLAWAKSFNHYYFVKNGDNTRDYTDFIGWFANNAMAMHDCVSKQKEAKIAEQAQIIEKLKRAKMFKWRDDV